MQPEPSHAALQARFHAALWQPDPPRGLAAVAQDELAQRFAVYRNNVQHSLTRALAARFPVVEQIVGAAFFTAMARVFIAASPPADPVMLRWGGVLPAFLDGFPPAAQLPYLGDVARLEYARGRACHAADAPSVAPEALNVPGLEDLRLRLHPSVHLFASPHPAVQIWQAHQPGSTRAPLRAGPNHAVIARAPDFAVVVEPVDAASFAVLSMLSKGATLGHAASQADPTPALTLLLRYGLISDALTGDIQ